MKINRKRNAISGTFFGIILRIVQVLFPFLIRTIFIRTIGIEYLGLNSLFTAVLEVLNLAELGVSSALVFSMYKPIAEDNEEKICQLMKLYQLYYRVVGIIILGIGLVLIPFIPNLITGEIPTDINLYVIYLMNLGATVISYWLFAYRTALFEAHQRTDIISIVTIVVNLCIYGLQILSLIWLKNYYYYLALKIFGQIGINLVLAFVSKKQFPQYRPEGNLPAEERKTIQRQMRDLFTSKIGSVINNSADSIVISSFLGLKLLAVYQNYYYVISALMAIFNIFYAACAAGIGNSLIVRGEEENRELLYRINHIVFFGINFCCSCLICLYQPFMELWVGKEFLLPFDMVVLFCVYLYAEEAPRTLIVFKDAGGIWRKDRFRPLTSACTNLILNLLFTRKFGLYGIIISTIVSFMFVSFPWVIYNINKCMFKINIQKYIKKIILYTIVIAINCCLAAFVICTIDVGNLWLTLILRFIICCIISNGLFIFAFIRTDETAYLLYDARRLIKKVRA